MYTGSTFKKHSCTFVFEGVVELGVKDGQLPHAR